MGKKICRYILGFSRSADLEGVFVMNDEQFKAIEQMDGYEVHYGEIAGKHSDVSATLLCKDIEVLSDKPEDVEVFERLFPNGVGFAFVERWFDTDRAYDAGWEAAGCKAAGHPAFKTAEAALEDYSRYSNAVMFPAFERGFNNHRKDKAQVDLV